jgi:hypothetical protein
MAHGLRSPGVQTDRAPPVLSRPLRGRRCSHPAPRLPLGRRLPWQPLPGLLDPRLSPADRACLRPLRPPSEAASRPLRPLHGRDRPDLPPDRSPPLPPSAAPLCPLLQAVPVGSHRPRLPSAVVPLGIRLPLPGPRPRSSKATVLRHRRPRVPSPLPDTRSKARLLRSPVDSPPRHPSPRPTSRSRSRSHRRSSSPPQVQATDPS